MVLRAKGRDARDHSAREINRTEGVVLLECDPRTRGVGRVERDVLWLEILGNAGARSEDPNSGLAQRARLGVERREGDLLDGTARALNKAIDVDPGERSLRVHATVAVAVRLALVGGKNQPSVGAEGHHVRKGPGSSLADNREALPGPAKEDDSSRARAGVGLQGCHHVVAVGSDGVDVRAESRQVDARPALGVGRVGNVELANTGLHGLTEDLSVDNEERRARDRCYLRVGLEAFIDAQGCATDEPEGCRSASSRLAHSRLGSRRCATGNLLFSKCRPSPPGKKAGGEGGHGCNQDRAAHRNLRVGERSHRIGPGLRFDKRQDAVP